MPAPNKAALKAKAQEPGSSIPDNVKKPNDHLPAKSDVDGVQDVDVEWNGHTYTVLAEARDDAELLEHLTDQNHVGALMCLLGREGWFLFKVNERDPETGRVSVTEAAKFLQHVMDVLRVKN